MSSEAEDLYSYKVEVVRHLSERPDAFPTYTELNGFIGLKDAVLLAHMINRVIAINFSQNVTTFATAKDIEECIAEAKRNAEWQAWLMMAEPRVIH